MSPVSPAAAPSPIPLHNPHSHDSPTSWTLGDIDALVRQLVRQARAIPSIPEKWLSRLQCDLEAAKGKQTKANIKELLADDTAMTEPLPQLFPTT